MSLSGNLSTMSLPDLLQWLHGSLKTGSLEVRQGQFVKRVIFRNGEIASSSSNDPTEYLGQFLLSHGMITEEDLQAGMDIQKETGVMLGKILLDQGKLTQEDLNRHLTLKAEETIFSIFLWEDARFDFEEEELPEGNFVPLRLSISDVLLKGLSRYDELQRMKHVFGTFATVVGRTDTQPGPEFLSHPRRRVVWEKVDGQRSISQIALELHMAEFLACEVIHLLYRMKHLSVVRRVSFEDLDDGARPAPDDPLAEARRQLTQGNLEAAIDVVDSASRGNQAAELEDLRRQAQQAYLDQAYGTELPPEKILYLQKSVEELTSEALSPQEVFLLSRINGTWDVQSVITIAPFPELDVVRTLKSLLRKEIIGLR